MGECGFRGGYGEIVNLDPDVKKMLLKSISAKLCPTVLGQVRAKSQFDLRFQYYFLEEILMANVK